MFISLIILSVVSLHDESQDILPLLGTTKYSRVTDISYHWIFIPWTFSTITGPFVSFVLWTIHIVIGLFAPFPSHNECLSTNCAVRQ